MIKVQNKTATRTPIPKFLKGLKPASLVDLSWTDPALGVQDAAWWPEVDQSPALGQHEKYGAETLTVDAENQRVVVTREVVPWTAEEIEAEVTAARENMQPISRMQFAIALAGEGIISGQEAKDFAGGNSLPAIASAAIQGAALTDGEKLAAEIKALSADTIRRTNPLVFMMQAAAELTDEQVDDLFTFAAGID